MRRRRALQPTPPRLRDSVGHSDRPSEPARGPGRGFAGATALLCGAALAAAGCRLQHLEADLVAAADVAALAGRVEVVDWDGASPIQVVVYVHPEDDASPIRIVRHETLLRPGLWAFTVDAGRYRVAAFVDTDRDERFDEGEPAADLDAPIDVVAGEEHLDVVLRVEGAVDPGVLTGGRGVEMDLPVRVGEVVALEDPRFSLEAAVEGVWKPLRSVERFPPGLYLLEPHDPGRTPVVLVHGLGGHAREFSALLEALDGTRFEPWLFQYPSAYPLRLVATVLHRALNQMSARHGPERVCVVAHSMGGLVARQVLRLQEEGPATNVRGLVTIASPFGGMDSAAAGVDMAPVVVPAWRDLVPGGPFLRQLFGRPLPEGVEHHLLFAYQDQGASDGAVLLRSQLRPAAQAEAAVVRGFPASHVGVLSDPDAIAQVQAALDRCRGDRPDAARIAPRPSLTGGAGVEPPAAGPD